MLRDTCRASAVGIIPNVIAKFHSGSSTKKAFCGFQNEQKITFEKYSIHNKKERWTKIALSGHNGVSNKNRFLVA